MKTKIYPILTGLLMAACITSYGQEIIGTFTSTSYSTDCDIAEASDGSIIVGSYCGGDDYTVYKLSHEGTPIDDISLSGTAYFEAQLLEMPATPDCFLAAFVKGQPNYIMLKFFLIDADLFILDEANASIQVGTSYGMNYKTIFITPDKRIVVSYSVNNGENYVRHYAFYSLSGTLLEDLPITEILSDASLNAPATDTLLNGFYLKTFTETPITYSCLGKYDMDGANHFVNYLLDNDFNLTNRIEYATITPDIPFSNIGATVIPFNQPDAATHLLYTYTSPNQPTLIKYDNEGTPVAFHRFPEASTDANQMTTAKDQNTIYYTHGKFQFGATKHLIRLNGDLEIAWEALLPCPSTQQNVLRSMKVLQNGDLAVGTTLENTSSTSILQVYIIRDEYDGIPEKTTPAQPFSLYPNPVNNKLNLLFSEITEPESLELYDLDGRLISTKHNNIETIDMSAMSAGVYMLRVTMKDGTSYHEKVIKE